MIRAVELQPKNKTALNNLGTAYKELGKINESIDIYKKILEIDPNHSNANYNLGLAFIILKDLKKAKFYLKKTTEIQKNYALAFYSLGNIHYELKELKEALSCYQKAQEINPNIVGIHNNLGLLYRDLNDFDNAINCYERAINIKPEYANAHHNLAELYREKGDFNNSIKFLKNAIELEPQNLMSYNFLCEIKKDELNLDLKKKIGKIFKSNNASVNNLAYGNYLLAKYERNEKNYKKELNYLIEGHKSFFKTRERKFNLGLKYCFDDVLQIEDNIVVKKTSKKDQYEIKPIFIFGVPRCGSTLVEKIIGSGKNFIPLGEEAGVIGNYIISKVLKKQSVNLGSAEDIRNELLEIYKDKGLVLKKYNYTFTDKSLDNFFYLKLIKEIYPNAKLIHCKRNVLSSIMSIFQNNLTHLAWAHNLDNIFKYFSNYFKIVENFKKSNLMSIYDLNFEDLINNPEKESKKLMKYCGLVWDKKCLEFYKRKDLLSKTASNIQIRNKIYKHSLNKYLPYKKLLNEYGKNYSWFN